MFSRLVTRILVAASLLAVTTAQDQRHLAPFVGDDQYLKLPAVTSDANNTDARIECWQFTKPFDQYPTVGRALALADLSNITYVVLPPRSKEGLHHPPAPMLFVLVSGIAHVTLPAGKDELWIRQIVNQVIVANDIHGIGHNTEYPSDQETVALQLPFKDGIVPEHLVLHSGACGLSE